MLMSWLVQSLPLSQLELLVPGCSKLVDTSELSFGLDAQQEQQPIMIPEVSTGLPYLLIPVRGAAALAQVRVFTLDSRSFLLRVGCRLDPS